MWALDSKCISISCRKFVISGKNILCTIWMSVDLFMFVVEFYFIRATEHPLCPENGEYVRVPSYNSSMVILPHKTFDEVRNKLLTFTWTRNDTGNEADDSNLTVDSVCYGKYLKGNKHNSIHLDVIFCPWILSLPQSPQFCFRCCLGKYPSTFFVPNEGYCNNSNFSFLFVHVGWIWLCLVILWWSKDQLSIILHEYFDKLK